MKLLVCLLLIPAIAYASRAKRFATLASGIGGAAGCVVTGNTLYANGFKVRDLNGSELDELKKYEGLVTEYKTKVKAALEQRREALKKQFGMGQQGGDNSMNNNAVTEADKAEMNLEPPARPSFCGEDITTQYYFDGCMVQDNKVYVGRTYARDLSSDEVNQLKAFDEKMTAYQKQLQANIQNQVKGMFGGSDFFSALFGGEAPTEAPVATSTQQAVSTSSAAPLTVPEPPQFCVAV